MATKSNGTDSSTSAMDRKFTGLRRFNLGMGFLHLVQGIFMIVVSNDTTYPIYTNFLNFDIATRSLKPNAELVYELPFGVAVAFFLLISAVAHFYLATIGYQRYVENLKKGMNPVRFYEYALSSSLMIVLIGMLIGIWDLGAIILIFAVNATMNLFGNHDGAAQPAHRENELDGFYLRLHRRDRAVDRDHALLRGRGQFWGCQAASICIHHCPDIVCLFQYLRHQHGLAVQEDWSVEGLPVRGTCLYHPEPVG